KYRGFVVQNVAIGAAAKNSTATIQRCRISLDPDNYVSFEGTAGITEPYPYEARAQIRLPQLDRFNELVKDFGQPAGLSGAFNLDATSSGDTRNPAANVQAKGDQIKYRGLPIGSIRAEMALRNSEAKLETCRIAFD